MVEQGMTYRVESAYFAHKLPRGDVSHPGAVLVAIDAAAHPVNLHVVVNLVGPPNAQDTATLGVLLPDSNRTVIGPESFRFSNTGHATLVFILHAMPVSAPGHVSAQLLFSGETAATHVCGLLIRMPDSAPSGTTLH
jgi:hypothetical protein